MCNGHIQGWNQKRKEFKNLNPIHEQDICKDGLSMIILLYMGTRPYCHLLNKKSRDHRPSLKEWKRRSNKKTREEEIQLHDFVGN